MEKVEPVNWNKVSIIRSVYLPSNQSRAKSFGTPMVNVSSINPLGFVFFSHVSKLGLLIFSAINSRAAVHNSSRFSNKFSHFFYTLIQYCPLYFSMGHTL